MSRVIPWCTLFLFAARALYAQEPVDLTLTRAVESAAKHYPSIRVSAEQVSAAAAGIRLARTAYLPRIDALAQVNRATRNNVFGLTLPQNVISPISGPVIGSNNGGSVWGSAAGVLVTWEPFDFGLRGANIRTAAALRAQAQAAEKRTQFDVAVAAAESYLTLVAAVETAKAAEAGVDRAMSVSQVVAAQVNAELRPGADKSRTEAEVAAARTQLIQAQQAADIARVTLQQFTNLDAKALPLRSGRLTDLPPERVGPSTPDLTANPTTREQNASVEQAVAQLRALERSYFPRFALQASAYARGTGAEIDGTRLGGANGLAPNVQNYALGFTVTFPILDLPSLRAREAEQAAVIRARRAQADQLAIDLKAQWSRAAVSLENARRIAANTPVQTIAARDASAQAKARYEAGLATIDQVAEAQRLLTQAEIDDALARLNIWRSLLGLAAAAGDLTPFIAEVGQ